MKYYPNKSDSELVLFCVPASNKKEVSNPVPIEKFELNNFFFTNNPKLKKGWFFISNSFNKLTEVIPVLSFKL